MAETMKNKDEMPREKNLWLEIYQTLADVISCLIFVTVLFVFAIRLVGVVGGSMNATLYDGDRLALLSNFLYEPEVGDIVVLKAAELNGGETIIKRVIADEGQTVDIDFATGEVWVDGVLLQEDYILEPTLTYEGVEFPVTVPEGCIFVMGDNRNHSTDSRNPRVGCVDKRFVLGKAIFIVTPFGRIGGIS